MDQETFNSRVEAFIKSVGMNPTEFGRGAVNDPQFVFDLRRGRECREATRKRTLRFMESEIERMRGRVEKAAAEVTAEAQPA